MFEEFDYKSLTLEQLEWVFSGVQFKRTPFWHQYVSLAFAEDKARVCFWHGIGSGKTLCGYYAAQRKRCRNILVVCPKYSVSAWIRDIKWTDYLHLLISGTTPERQKKMADQSVNVHIIPYFALKTVFSTMKRKSGVDYKATSIRSHELEAILQEHPDWKPVSSRRVPGTFDLVKSKGRSWQVDTKLLDKYDFDCLILDEVHKCSSSSALQTKICKEISARVPYVVALSGTPVDRALLEMFHIYDVVDLGRTFGTNFWQFRLEHFEEHMYDWKIREGHEEIILRQVMPITLSFSHEECTDLPSYTDDSIFLDATEEYRKLEKRIVLGKPIDVAGSKATFGGASVRATKLRQLNGGFIYLPGGEVFRLKDNPKLDTVLDLLHTTGMKMILWYLYRQGGDLIEEALSKQKPSISCLRIQGGMSAEEVIEVQRRFQEEDDQIIVCQESCNEGWDGFAAEITVFWDPIISPRRRNQCIGRMWRTGQEKRTLVYNLVLKGTSDEKALEAYGTREEEIVAYMRYMQDYETRVEKGRT